MALNLPHTANNSQTSGTEPAIPKPAGKPATKSTEKEESRFSANEKIKLLFLGIFLFVIPIFIAVIISRFSYKKELEQYKSASNHQLIQLQDQINLLANPAIKQLEELENAFKSKRTKYFKEKEELEKNSEYQELIKKNKELDNQIITCTVHLNSIEKVKRNNYKEVDVLIENLKKEIIK